MTFKYYEIRVVVDGQFFKAFSFFELPAKGHLFDFSSPIDGPSFARVEEIVWRMFFENDTQVVTVHCRKVAPPTILGLDNAAEQD